MKKITLYLVLIAAAMSLWTGTLFAQAPRNTMPGFERAPEPIWSRHFGSAEDDGAYAVLALDDGGFAVAGDCIDLSSEQRQMCLMRLGKHGDLIFTKQYAGSGFSSARSLQTTNDGGFVLAGSTRGPGGTGTDLYVVKTDHEGDVEWYRISQDRGADFSQDVVHARGGGFVSAGGNALDLTGSYNLVKMNKPGTVVWTRNFPGEQANAIIEISNGRLIAVGYTKEIPDEIRPINVLREQQMPWEVDPAKKDTGLCREESAWLMTEVDWKGVERHKWTYWHSGYDVAHAVTLTEDGGYVLAGSVHGCRNRPEGYDCWVVRADSTGDTLWTAQFGGAYEDQAYSILADADGGFIVSGITRSWGQGGADVLLYKLDGRGVVLWSTTVGGPGDEIGYDVQFALEGLCVSGTTTSYGSGDTDMYLVKLEAPGP
ncbi:hypothetical protein IT157_01025 [bacterium]|nr:hypothetical protein [bacterium]